MSDNLRLILDYPDCQSFNLNYTDPDGYYRSIVTNTTQRCAEFMLRRCPVFTEEQTLESVIASIVYELHDEYGLLGDGNWHAFVILDHLKFMLKPLFTDLLNRFQGITGINYINDAVIKTTAHYSFYIVDITIGGSNERR